MNAMKRAHLPFADERGAVLILALLVMMVLAVFSTVAIMSAMQGLTISSKYKIHQQATYVSDAAADFAGGFINRVIANDKKITGLADVTSANVWINTANTDGTSTLTDLEREISGVNGSNTAINSDAANSSTPNLTVTIMGDTAKIDIDFWEPRKIAGTSSEFAARYEGIGAGGAGGTALVYRIETYSNVNGTEVALRAFYKCVEGPGGCL